MSDKSRIYYKTVPANSEDNDPVIIPNGQSWKVQSWIGEAHPFKDTTVCIVWDHEGASPETVALTHSSSNHKLDFNAVGDGTKVLAICLQNDSSGPVDLGVEFVAKNGG